LTQTSPHAAPNIPLDRPSVPDTLLDQPTLQELGWNERLEGVFAALEPLDVHALEDGPPVVIALGRVIAVHRGRWTVSSPEGLIGADLLGIFRLGSTLAVPAVGDWVRVVLRSGEDSKADAALSAATGRKLALLSGTVHDVLPRHSVLVRKTSGDTSDGQVIAANADIVLIAVPLDADINPRRMERQLTTVWDSGARPVFIATKADVATPGALESLREAAGDVEVIPTSTTTGQGFERVTELAADGVSLVLLGTSGAGKSTLANELLGNAIMATQQMGARGKGLHTTTHRELLKLPTGALLIDTPGMREMGLWMSGGEDGVAATFAEVDEVAAECRFSDCSHTGDNGCAIGAALSAGTLDKVRVEAWRRLSNEQSHNAKRVHEREKGKASKRSRR
jgi:ribosome biogenesis GTPase / thiamine phosphate phosphatase